MFLLIIHPKKPSHYQIFDMLPNDRTQKLTHDPSAAISPEGLARLRGHYNQSVQVHEHGGQPCPSDAQSCQALARAGLSDINDGLGPFRGPPDKSVG